VTSCVDRGPGKKDLAISAWEVLPWKPSTLVWKEFLMKLRSWWPVLALLLVVLLPLVGCGFSPEEKRLEKKIKDPSPEVRKEAAEELAKLATPRALQLLEMAVDDKDPFAKQAIQKSLAELKRRPFLR